MASLPSAEASPLFSLRIFCVDFQLTAPLPGFDEVSLDDVGSGRLRKVFRVLATSF